MQIMRWARVDFKKIFEKFERQNIIIRETTPSSVDGSKKAALNRKGNLLFNSGDIETAKRIFITTGYTDGLCRVGDYYISHSRLIDALRMYWIAPDHAKAEPIIMQLSNVLHQFLHNEEVTSNE